MAKDISKQESIISHHAHLQYNPRHNWNMVPPVPDGPRRDKPCLEANIPERFELFILGENEKKVTEEIDTRKSFCIFPTFSGSSCILFRNRNSPYTPPLS